MTEKLRAGIDYMETDNEIGVIISPATFPLLYKFVDDKCVATGRPRAPGWLTSMCPREAGDKENELAAGGDLSEYEDVGDYWDPCFKVAEDNHPCLYEAMRSHAAIEGMGRPAGSGFDYFILPPVLEVEEGETGERTGVALIYSDLETAEWALAELDEEERRNFVLPPDGVEVDVTPPGLRVANRILRWLSDHAGV
jgi:hypothetical protein